MTSIATVIHGKALGKQYRRGSQVDGDIFFFNRMESSVADRI